MERHLGVILCVILLFSSCAGNGTETKNPVTSVFSETEAITEFDNRLPANDLNGYIINFIGKGASFANFEVYDVYVESATGDLLNDALYARNKKLEETYNFDIAFAAYEGNLYGGTRPSEEVQKTVQAGDAAYDVIYDGLSSLVTLAQEKMVYDLFGFPHIDFTNPWWNEAFNAQMSICDKLYFTYGSHMLGPYDGLYCVLFNKQLVEDFNLGNMYDLVHGGSWTLDTLALLMKNLAVDLDGDGIIGYDDLLPYCTEGYNAYTFYVGAGGKIAEKDTEDVPYLTIGTERSLSIINEVMKVMQNEDISIAENYGADRGWDTYVDHYLNGFIENRYVFREGALMEIDDLRGMNTDFGILPSPKYNPEQTEYHHIFSVWNAAMMSVPVNVKDAEAIGFILEAMAAESYHSVIPEYIERHLVTKYTRDNESEAIIHIILNSMTMDLGAVFNWSNLMHVMINSQAINGTDTYVSTYEKTEPSALAELEKTVSSFTDIN
ncbi:MAG: hypothetical protein PHZ09_11160 [Eubacteriales bacterium]|nr:hypothetical protein [Eubacteriales bacterium]